MPGQPRPFSRCIEFCLQCNPPVRQPHCEQRLARRATVGPGGAGVAADGVARVREAPHVVGQGKSKTPHGEYGEFETCSPANDVQLDGSHARRGLLTGPRWNEHVCGCAEIHACPIPGTRRLPAAGWKLGGAPSSVLRQGTVAVPTGHRSGLEPSAVWVRAAGPALSAKNAGRRTCFSLRLIPVPARVGKDASTSLDIAILSTRAPPAARMTRPDFRRACACVGGCDELVDRCLSDEPAHCDGSASLPALLGLSSLKLQHTLLSPASTSSCMASVSAATSATDGEFFFLVCGGGGGFVWWWWWGVDGGGGVQSRSKS